MQGVSVVWSERRHSVHTAVGARPHDLCVCVCMQRRVAGRHNRSAVAGAWSVSAFDFCATVFVRQLQDFWKEKRSACLVRAAAPPSCLRRSVCVVTSGQPLPALGCQSQSLWPSYQNTRRLDPLLSRRGPCASAASPPARPSPPSSPRASVLFRVRPDPLAPLPLLTSLPLRRSERVPRASPQGADRPAVPSGGSGERSLSALPPAVSRLRGARLPRPRVHLWLQRRRPAGGDLTPSPRRWQLAPSPPLRTLTPRPPEEVRATSLR